MDFQQHGYRASKLTLRMKEHGKRLLFFDMWTTNVTYCTLKSAKSEMNRSRPVCPHSTMQ